MKLVTIESGGSAAKSLDKGSVGGLPPLQFLKFPRIEKGLKCGDVGERCPAALKKDGRNADVGIVIARTEEHVVSRKLGGATELVKSIQDLLEISRLT